jgi:outer membrane lipoprotein-sorting protein
LDTVNAPPILQRHPALRWLVPVGIACVAGLVATGMFKADASSESQSLPRTTPAALIAAVQDSQVRGFSGTVVSHISLGLPDLSSVPQADDDTSFTGLLSGSHTMQVWYGGVDRQRVALLGATDEDDLFRDGRDVWQWSSSTHVAVHSLLPKRPRPDGGEPTAPTSITPSALARQALQGMAPGTQVTVDTGHTVADRSAYELVLTPRTDATKVGSVRISIDGATKVPLGVQVYPRRTSSPAVDVAFTSIRFGQQANRNFAFAPPPGAQVRRVRSAGGSPDPSVGGSVTRTGTGWATVVGVTPGRQVIAKYARGALLKQLTPVSGSWGKGHLLDADLVSVLVTDDGRVYAGAVPPAELYAAASK